MRSRATYQRRRVRIGQWQAHQAELRHAPVPRVPHAVQERLEGQLRVHFGWDWIDYAFPFAGIFPLGRWFGSGFRASSLGYSGQSLLPSLQNKLGRSGYHCSKQYNITLHWLGLRYTFSISLSSSMHLLMSWTTLR